jgi:hypothetical protein
LTHRVVVLIERSGGHIMHSEMPYANDSHELLMGCALGLGLGAMAGVWWLWACLHG